MLKALIFDVDGTLAETEADGHRVAFNMAFKEAGINWHWDHDVYGELLDITGGRERLHHYWRTVEPEALDAENGDQRVAELHRRKNALYWSLVAAGKIFLRSGIAALINAAREAGIQTAIATSTSRGNVDALLQATWGPNWTSGFPVVVTSDDVAHKKPAPDIYLETLRQLDCDAADCLALEDSPAGLTAAQRAGIPCVVTRGFYTATHPMPGALACLNGLGSAEAPCEGVSPDGPFRGVVDLSQLQAWHRTASPS